jgi:hypothetical protein
VAFGFWNAFLLQSFVSSLIFFCLAFLDASMATVDRYNGRHPTINPNPRADE